MENFDKELLKKYRKPLQYAVTLLLKHVNQFVISANLNKENYIISGNIFPVLFDYILHTKPHDSNQYTSYSAFSKKFNNYLRDAHIDVFTNVIRKNDDVQAAVTFDISTLQDSGYKPYVVENWGYGVDYIAKNCLSDSILMQYFKTRDNILDYTRDNMFRHTKSFIDLSTEKLYITQSQLECILNKIIVFNIEYEDIDDVDLKFWFDRGYKVSEENIKKFNHLNDAGYSIVITPEGNCKIIYDT